jgi:hypothetical protein
MSERRLVWLALASVMVAPVALRAQGSIAAQERHVAALAAAAARADSVSRRADSLARAQAKLDTLAVGTLDVITEAAVARAVRPHVRAAWDSVSAILGPDTTLLTDRYGAFAPESGLREYRVAGSAQVDTGEAMRYLTGQLIGLVQATLLRAGGAELTHWTGGSLGFGADTTWLVHAAYAALVTTPSRAVRLCRAGDWTSCAAALDIGPDTARAATWYTPEDLHALSARGVRWQDDLVPPPLSSHARLSLVVFATRHGAPGAFSRLLADTAAPIADRLASASGMSLPELMQGWRAWILSAKTPTPAGASAHTEWAAVGWIVVLVALGARSSRWRLG